MCCFGRLLHHFQITKCETSFLKRGVSVITGKLFALFKESPCYSCNSRSLHD